MGKLFLLVLGILVSVVVVYQSGERKVVQRLERPANKVVRASEEVVDEAKAVAKETGNALGLPEAKKKLEEMSK